MSTDTHGAPSETENALHIEAQQHLQPSHPIAPDSDLPSDGKKDVASMGDEKTNSIPPFLHSPPESNNAPKSDGSDSELSDLEDEPMVDGASLSNLQPAAEETSPDALPQPEEIEDIGEVIPDHWSGAVPVFKPTMHQFKDFQHFMGKVDSYGMKSGIIKIIPPEEWKAAQPPLDDLVKQVRVREPIKQDIMGSNGTYRQVNILHGRSYNVPQWRQLCEKSEHQPPARRGERRAHAEVPKATRPKTTASKASEPSTPKKRGRGRPAKGKGKNAKVKDEERPMTPVSPRAEPADLKDEVLTSVEKEINEGTSATVPKPAAAPRRMGGVKPQQAKTQSVSARRKFSKREGSAMIDEEAFKDFDYQLDTTEYTPERCEELERSYWKTLTYAQPLYGADMMGTLFDERTEIWNLNKLPNILDVLGSKVPGVNTAYLYLGMWKATFAWHLEDVDLYSINYLHFGAPKQWYSISQADAKRFEGAMKNIWPADAKACPQFLRHKGFLISPQHLLQNYNIKVNKVVSYPGEFVVTYPYGYHSGYNLGYNCAEAVNFALEPWLEMGKIAKKCECAQAQDSVWIDVHAIERKLRGEETEYEETEDEEDEDEEDEEMSGLPTPPASHGVQFKEARKRKGRPARDGQRAKKKIKLRLKAKTEPPCCLCPNDYEGIELLPTEDGRKAHRTCALYIPETYIEVEGGIETIYGVTRVHKDRLELKCLFCRSKRGACFQCSQKKCARAYHATCAAAAGVFVEEEEVPVFGEDGTEYKEQAFEFSCRFHRTKRDKKLDSVALEEDSRIRKAAAALSTGEMCQMQLYRGEIFAGVVVENRPDEQMLLLDTVPNRQRMEVEWKWLLLPDPADYHLPKASAKAIPMPASQKAKDRLNTKRADDKPRKDDVFGPGLTWAEYNFEAVSNRAQAKIDFEKSDQIWHYLGKTSTEARAQYTEDPSRPRFNPKGNFLDTLPKPPPKPRPVTTSHFQYRPQQGTVPYENGGQFHQGGSAQNLAFAMQGKPYNYKPKANTMAPTQFATQRFAPTGVAPSPSASGPQTAVPVNGHLTHQQEMTSKWRVPLTGPSPTADSQHQTLPAPQQSRPQTKPSWQVHSSIYQKYPFFNANYNRDSSKYRTPYSPTGGFTNGWEGSYSAYATPGQTQPQRSNSSSVTHHGSGGSHKSSHAEVHSGAQSQSFHQNGTQASFATSASTSQIGRVPAQNARPRSSHASKPPPPLKQAVLGLTNAAVPTVRTPKVAPPPPSKQSPVPLPPNIMAAMRTSSGSSPPAVGAHRVSQASSVGGGSLQAAVIAKQESSPQAANPSRISVSRVPIPSFSVITPHQHAAQVAASRATEHTQPVEKSVPDSRGSSGRSSDAGIQAFPDVPAGSTEFVERLMGNLRRVSQHNRG